MYKRRLLATLATVLAAVLATALAQVLSFTSTAGATSSPTLTYSAQVTIPAPPPSNFSGAAAGGDGWGLAFTTTQVFNVFHHQTYLGVNCHNTSDASSCWPGFSYKTITDGSGHGYSTSGQPGLYIDQATGHLYVYATQISNNTAGVVCIDTTAAAAVADPFCGFTALSAVGDAPLGGSFSQISSPVLFGSDWYAFNGVGGTPSGTRDEVMCFDVAVGAACANQPFAVTLGTSSIVNDHPMPTIALVGGKVIIPVPGNTGIQLTCFDPSTDATCTGGNWPISVASFGGAPFPLLSSSGTTTGVCLPISGDPCYDLNGGSVSTPAGLSATTGASDNWNGPAVVLGTNVYVPTGNIGAGEVTCYDYATDASCANFPKSFSNLSYLYTVTSDPFLPTCLWVNADSGTDQIQNFDAISGGSCAQAPLRVQASSFVAPSDVCVPASFTSLQVVSPAPSAYTSGSVQFEDANYVPIPGIATHSLNANGSTDLTNLNLPTTDALPQFVITLNGLTGSPSAVTLNVTWSGTYSPACVTPTAVVTTATAPGAPTGVSAIGGIGSADVSWTAPSFDGYSPVTSYTVTAYDPSHHVVGTCTATAPATDCIVHGLSSATLYTFSVVAINAIGLSPAATGTGYSGLFTPPGPPTAVSATPSDGAATVAWSAPSNDGGDPVTSYTVTAYDALDAPAGTCSVAASSTSCTVGGLSNGSDYTFEVVATNVIGSSIPSAASSLVSPEATPSSPVPLLVTPSSPVSLPVTPSAPTNLSSQTESSNGRTGSVLISWYPSAGGAPSTTIYLVTVEPGGKTCTTTGSSCVVQSVPLGVHFSYTVTAQNSTGTGTSESLSALSASLSPNHKALLLAPTYAPVAVTCSDAQCLGVANVSVARRVFKGTKQVGWRHLILGRATFTLTAGQKVTLRMIDTLLGKIVLPRQVHWWRAHQPKFRLTLTTVILGSPTTHHPVYLR